MYGMVRLDWSWIGNISGRFALNDEFGVCGMYIGTGIGTGMG